jgi:hypothetical protein
MITPSSVDKFLAESAATKATKLKIFSLGGELHASIRLARWVKSKDMDVEASVVCYSGCANYVFPAGRNKTIGPGALVLWHGTMEQSNFRETLKRFDEISARQKQGSEAITAEELTFLEGNQKLVLAYQKALEDERAFFRDIGVNEAIGRLGQEPVRYPAEAWTATVRVMARYGIPNVKADPQYGTIGYMRRNPFVAFLTKGQMLTFDIAPSGELVADQGSTSAKAPPPTKE